MGKQQALDNLKWSVSLEEKYVTSLRSQLDRSKKKEQKMQTEYLIEKSLYTIEDKTIFWNQIHQIEGRGWDDRLIYHKKLDLEKLLCLSPIEREEEKKAILWRADRYEKLLSYLRERIQKHENAPYKNMKVINYLNEQDRIITKLYNEVCDILVRL